MQQVMRLEASGTAMYAGVFRNRIQADGPGVAEPEQYGDFAVVENVLRGKGIPVDFESDVMLRFNHRRDGQKEIFFVANPADSAVDGMCTFRVSGKQPELWDPVTGTTRVLSGFQETDGRTSVRIHFEPQQSIFVVFENTVTTTNAAGSTARPFTEAVKLQGGWDVVFDRSWGRTRGCALAQALGLDSSQG